MKVFIGTAGWAVPKDLKADASKKSSGLEQYSKLFNSVEINTSFYRDHKANTYERWYDSVDVDFRFAIKLSKVITHDLRLNGVAEVLDTVLPPIFKLREKLGCILVQIPPSLQFNPDMEESFFAALRRRYDGMVAFEARHRSWFSPAVQSLMERFRIGPVAADPIPFKNEVVALPENVRYFRLHGSPIIYQSEYTEKALEIFADRIRLAQETGDTWCIFDNTMYGHASHNAISMKWLLQKTGAQLTFPVG